MLRLKSCPKCKGDLMIDRDMYGWYEQCLQCGYLHTLEPLPKVEVQDIGETKEPARAGSGRASRTGVSKTNKRNEE